MRSPLWACLSSFSSDPLTAVPMDKSTGKSAGSCAALLVGLDIGFDAEGAKKFPLCNVPYCHWRYEASTRYGYSHAWKCGRLHVRGDPCVALCNEKDAPGKPGG